MTNNLPSPSDEIQSAWQGQSSEPFNLSPAAIRLKLAQLEQKIQRARRRRFVGYGVGLFVVLAFIKNFLDFPSPLERIGAILTILGTGYLMYQLRQSQGRKGWASLAGGDGSATSFSYYRRELERMRDFHCGRLFWLRLGLFLPGPLVFITGFTLAHPELLRSNLWNGIFFVVLGTLAIPLNLWLAHRYQRKIDDLDRMQKEL
jgi:hypothetical protein